LAKSSFSGSAPSASPGTRSDPAAAPDEAIPLTDEPGLFADGIVRRAENGRLAEAIRDNELRVEYMGASVQRVIHLNYVIAAALAGIGGALMAGAIGHVDPETTANWTTSGEFVFIAILSGTGSVLAPFLGAGVFEAVRTFALERFPNTWQMTLGLTMLLVIMFLPGGLWSMFGLRRRGA
jgi:branched-chain amino acid transport system permease protein